MKRAAIIGMGDIYPIHMAAIQAYPQITLCAVCDSDEAKEGQAPQGVPFYRDYKEMIRAEKPDCVHICLPHYLHYPVAKEAAGMGVHVFCEKPMAVSTAEAEAFSRLEMDYPKLQIGICLQNRRNETVELLKTFIDSKEYGSVTGIRGNVPWYRPKEYYDCKPWRGRWETAGSGCMMNQAIHTLDLLSYLGGKIRGVRATVSQILDYGIEVEDTVSASLDYENGARGLFMATNANFKNEPVQIVVQMEKGEFRIYDNILYQVMEDGTVKKLAEDRKMPGTKFYYGASHQKLISEFYHSLETGERSYVSAKDGEMSIRLICGILRAGETGAYISL